MWKIKCVHAEIFEKKWMFIHSKKRRICICFMGFQMTTKVPGMHGRNFHRFVRINFGRGGGGVGSVRIDSSPVGREKESGLRHGKEAFTDRVRTGVL